jgi:putative heme degradation protein
MAGSGKENRGRNNSKNDKNKRTKSNDRKEPGSAHSSSEKTKMKQATQIMTEVHNKKSLINHKNLLRK